MLTRAQFIMQMILEPGHRAGLSAKDAMPLAANIFQEFIADIGVPFGHRDYAWDGAAARTIVQQYHFDNA
jgi:hypothetical protein